MSSDILDGLMDEQPVPRHRKWIQRLIIVIALIEFVLAALLFLMMQTTGEPFLHGDQPGIYWLQLYAPDILNTVTQINCILIFLVGIMILGMQRLDTILFLLIAAIVIIAILTLLGPQTSSLVDFSEIRESRQFVHHTSLNTGGTVYQAAGVLTTYTAFMDCLNDNCSDYSFRPILFQCDRWGIMCRAIYHGADTPKTDEPPMSRLDISDGSIMFTVDGNIVWGYPDE
jgi:hypothetical protein